MCVCGWGARSAAQSLTITLPPVRIKPVSSVTAAGVRADVVMAILGTLVRTLCTLVNI